jgi:chromosomal replication initiator protein
MMVDIGFPDFETRVAILQMKVQEKGIFISNDVLSFIASNVTASVRELEGVLNQAIALYELRHITPTVKSIAPMLKKLHTNSKIVGMPDAASSDGIRSIEDIVRVVADYFKLLPEDLMGDSRRADIVLARQIAMYIAKKYFKMTYQYIGTYFQNRIHTTVMHAVEKIEKEMETDKQLKRDINALLHDMGVL